MEVRSERASPRKRHLENGSKKSHASEGEEANEKETLPSRCPVTARRVLEVRFVGDENVIDHIFDKGEGLPLNKTAVNEFHPEEQLNEELGSCAYDEREYLSALGTGAAASEMAELARTPSRNVRFSDPHSSEELGSPPKVRPLLAYVVGSSDCGESVVEERFTDLDFADDAVIFAESMEALIWVLERLSEESECLGLFGFSIVLYGLGSKRALLESFRNSMLTNMVHLVINGFFPSITIKSILSAITGDVLDYEGSFRNPLDQTSFILEALKKDPALHIFLIIHNIDGPMLRGEKTQQILAQLAAAPNLHVIASIDHINAPLAWDQSKMSLFNWLWYETTTYQPYVEETSYENSLLVQQSGALALSSLTHVMRSLTPNARGIFQLLAEFQLQNKDNPSYTDQPMNPHPKATSGPQKTANITSSSSPQDPTSS
ncbi:ORC2 protein, partial [Polypterus senegalus]